MDKKKKSATLKKKSTAKHANQNYSPDRLSIESLNSPISIFDGRKNEFTYFNPQFSRLTGYSSEELFSLDVQEFLKHIHAKDLLVVINEVIDRVHKASVKYIKKNKQQLSFNINYRIHHKDGHYIHVIVQNMVLEWNDNNNRASTLSLYTDVNHLKNNPVMYLTISALDKKDKQWKEVHREEFRPQPKMLSEREREVMKLIGLGITAAEIAKTLKMNYYTVRSHWRNIMNKTKCKSQDELKELAETEGWI